MDVQQFSYANMLKLRGYRNIWLTHMSYAQYSMHEQLCDQLFIHLLRINA